jgi:hypothetical protein
MHVILDHVPRWGQRRAFVRQVLLQLGVPATEVDPIADRVGQLLPKQFARMDMTDVLAILEKGLPIEWVNDLVQVSEGAADSLKREIIAIFAGVSRPAFPREVTAQILEAAARILGAEKIPENVAGPLSQSIEEVLVHDLWRSRDGAGHAALAAQVMYRLRTDARLDLRPSREG